MKKLLLIATLLFTFILQAQDREYIAKLNSLDKNSAVAIAQEYVSAGSSQWEPLYEKENDKSFSVYFINASLSPERKAMLKSEQRQCESGECCSVRFTKYNGLYKFDYVLMQYKDLFPIWKKYFSANATPEDLPDNLKMQEYKEGYTVYKFKPEEPPYWSIDKF
jgi:hypothetical protein